MSPGLLHKACRRNKVKDCGGGRDYAEYAPRILA